MGTPTGRLFPKVRSSPQRVTLGSDGGGERTGHLCPAASSQSGPPPSWDPEGRVPGAVGSPHGVKAPPSIRF